MIVNGREKVRTGGRHWQAEKGAEIKLERQKKGENSDYYLTAVIGGRRRKYTALDGYIQRYLASEIKIIRVKSIR